MFVTVELLYSQLWHGYIFFSFKYALIEKFVTRTKLQASVLCRAIVKRKKTNKQKFHLTRGQLLTLLLLTPLLDNGISPPSLG